MDTNQDHVTKQSQYCRTIHSTKDEFFFIFINWLNQTSLSEKVFFKPNNNFSKSIQATLYSTRNSSMMMNLNNSLKSRSTLLPLCLTHGIHSDLINAIFILEIYLTAQKRGGSEIEKTIIVVTCSTLITDLQNLSQVPANAAQKKSERWGGVTGTTTVVTVKRTPCTVFSYNLMAQKELKGMSSGWLY